MAICPVSRFCAINFTDGECAVDPDLRLEFGSPGRAGHEALGAGGIGGGEDVLPLADDLGRATEVDLSGREQADTAMPVLQVVPREEPAAEVLRLLDAGEPAGEAGVVLDGLEVRLRVRVVVRDPGTAQRLRDAEVGRAAPCIWPSWEIPCPNRVSTRGWTPCLRQVSSIRRPPRPAVSRSATIQPVT